MFKFILIIVIIHIKKPFAVGVDVGDWVGGAVQVGVEPGVVGSFDVGLVEQVDGGELHSGVEVVEVEAAHGLELFATVFVAVDLGAGGGRHRHAVGIVVGALYHRAGGVGNSPYVALVVFDINILGTVVGLIPPRQVYSVERRLGILCRLDEL